MKVPGFISLIVFTMLSSNAFSQSNVQNKSEEEIKILLCQKWKLMRFEAQGKPISLPSASKEFYMIFKTGGGFKKVDTGEFEGKWRYSHKTRTLSIDDDWEGARTYKIVNITRDKLILSFKFGKETVEMFLERIIN